MSRFARSVATNASKSAIESENVSNLSLSNVSSDARSYVPPSSSISVSASASRDAGTSPETRVGVQSGIRANPSAMHTSFVRDNNFVTQPPKPTKGLTGKISTLFRREASHERSGTDRKDGSVGVSSEHNESWSELRPSSSASMISKNIEYTQQRRSKQLVEPNRVSHAREQASKSSQHLPSSVVATTITTPRYHISDHSDDQSIGSISVHSKAGSTSKRIFYSSNQDDDSDDSYESRVSRSSRTSRASRVSRDSATRANVSASTGFSTHGERSRDEEEETDDCSYGVVEAQSAESNVGGIRRYRGFSTSIKSLFLDEPLVCAAMGCFGLVLSNRTEYLLQLRNERRGALSPRRGRLPDADARKKSPSRIVGIGLALTLLLMFSTFVIWGFGSGDGTRDPYLNDYMNGYENLEDQQKNQWWDDYLINDDDRYRKRSYEKYGDDSSNADDTNDNNMATYYYGTNTDDAGREDDTAANDGDNSAVDNTDDNRYLQSNREDNTSRHVTVHENSRMRDESPWYSTNDAQRSTLSSNHKIHGIFKVRDYQECIWNPITHFLLYKTNMFFRSRTHPRQRFVEEEIVSDDTESGAVNNDSSNGASDTKRDLASDIRIALLFVFLLFLGILGRRRRMRTRFYLVRARAQDDHLYFASSDEAAGRRVAFDDTREDQYEGACSHTLCGCYPSDEVEAHPNDEEVEVTDDGIFRRSKRQQHEDIVARGFNCCMFMCCGAFCKCWFQCLSICALAQEAREIRLLVPPRYQRVDYITHQPFHEYQQAVNDLRRGWLGKTPKVSGILPHYNALSRFSRWIVVLGLFLVVVIVATLYLNPRAAFSWQDAVVLIATFVQSFLVLFIVHGIFHKSDLSLDAVIKMFTAGFMVAVPSAFFFEGLLLNTALFIGLLVYYVMTVIVGESFVIWVSDHWRAVWLICELFNAFIVAALIEELCKYYTFRAVEHPDLVFLTGLQREKQDVKAVEGGLVKYPFASHQVQELVKDRSFDESSVSSYRSSDTKRNRRSRKSRKGTLLIEKTGTIDDEFVEDENDVRTHRQKAMAITTGMISVAVGLACAENFLYVFVLGGTVAKNGDDIMEAWIVLLFRSIFPVHALAAALQSINVIRKYVESDNDHGHRIGVGRVIFPAVMLHGTFDALLMGINVYIETSWDRYLDENGGEIVDGVEPYNSLAVNVIAWTSITITLMCGLLWYIYENRSQRARLIALDEEYTRKTKLKVFDSEEKSLSASKKKRSRRKLPKEGILM